MTARIDPWSSQQYADYSRLRDEFGIEAFHGEKLPAPSRLFRRGVVFGHRGFDTIQRAIDSNNRFTILTGLMPSGRMHIGHKMTMDQVIYFQGLGAEVFIAVADIEAFGARGMPLEKTKELAISEYVKNYIALGLEPGQIYFQSKRTAVKDIAYLLTRKVNISQMKALYGFDGGTTMPHLFAPLIQIGDILHVQLDEYGGASPTLVPVGIDQDPHIRLTRDVARSHRIYSLLWDDEGKYDGDAGVFIKVDDDVEGHIDRAREMLEGMGFSTKPNYGYKALFIRGITKEQVPAVDDELVRLEREVNPHGFFAPAATYHRFITGLTGGKMSSSVPESAIFLSDSPEEARKKVMSSKTGGRTTLAEQKEKGGEPDRCVVFELFLYHLEESDAALEKIRSECVAGERTCGTCKKEAAESMCEFLRAHREKVDAIDQSDLDRYIRWD